MCVTLGVDRSWSTRHDGGGFVSYALRATYQFASRWIDFTQTKPSKIRNEQSTRREGFVQTSVLCVTGSVRVPAVDAPPSRARGPFGGAKPGTGPGANPAGDHHSLPYDAQIPAGLRLRRMAHRPLTCRSYPGVALLNTGG